MIWYGDAYADTVEKIGLYKHTEQFISDREDDDTNLTVNDILVYEYLQNFNRVHDQNNDKPAIYLSEHMKSYGHRFRGMGGRCALRAAPYALRPTYCALRAAPYALRPTRCALRTAPYAL